MKNSKNTTSKKATSKKVSFNPKPQFGLSKSQWMKLMSFGKKNGVSFVPLVRQAVVNQFRLGAN